MRPAVDGGSRFGIVLNGSPLFTGGAGSGESEIRRYVLENDLVEAIIGLPTDMFYNTGISTYVWIVSNRKPEHRKGKVQLIDASSFWQKMRKSLGSKRKELSRRAHRRDHPPLRQLQGGRRRTAECRSSRIFKNEDFGYRTITVERPAAGRRGQRRARHQGQDEGQTRSRTPDLRDTENVPLSEDVEAYFKREVLPACAGCLDRPREDEGRLRNSVQPALLRLQAAARAGRDRRRPERRHRPHHDNDRGTGRMSSPRYQGYKDSGVEWLGDVPEHWPVKRLGFFFDERREKVSDKDYEPLSVTRMASCRSSKRRPRQMMATTGKGFARVTL